MESNQTVLEFIRSQVTKHGSQKAYARHLGVSQQYLNDVLSGRRDLSAELAALLGYKRLTVFVKRPKSQRKGATS